MQRKRETQGGEKRELWLPQNSSLPPLAAFVSFVVVLRRRSRKVPQSFTAQEKGRRRREKGRKKSDRSRVAWLACFLRERAEREREREEEGSQVQQEQVRWSKEEQEKERER